MAGQTITITALSELEFPEMRERQRQAAAAVERAARVHPGSPAVPERLAVVAGPLVEADMATGRRIGVAGRSLTLRALPGSPPRTALA